MTETSAAGAAQGADPLDDHDPTRRRIIDAARANLRRFGASKVTVVDIARDLGMSHSNVYRFFPSKADILDAVVEDWLEDERRSLAQLSGTTGAAAERLEHLVVALLERKRKKRTEDAELSALYYQILVDRPAALARYDATVSGAFARVIADGVRGGEFAVADVPAAVRVTRNALHAFFDPAYEQQNGEPAEVGARAVVRVLAAGFANRANPPRLDR